MEKNNYPDQLLMLNTLFDTMVDFINIQGPDHRIIRMNRSMSEQCRVNPDEAVGKKCYNLIGRDQACTDCAASRSYKTGKIEHTRIYVEQWDRWVDNYAYPVMDAHGKVELMFEHFHDVTKEVEGINLLKDNEWLYFQINNLSSELDQFDDEKSSIQVFTEKLSVILGLKICAHYRLPGNNEAPKFTFCSKGDKQDFVKLHGMSTDQVDQMFKKGINRDKQEILIIEDKDKPQTVESGSFYALMPIGYGEDQWYLELYNPVKNFTLSPVQKRLLELIGPRINLRLKNIRLINELTTKEKELGESAKKLEKEVEKRTSDLNENADRLEKTQKALAYMSEDLFDLQVELKETNKKLKEVNQELEAFSYSVSHDLRAPLVRMSGFSKMLMNEYKDVLDDTGKHYLNRIDVSARHLGELINAVLDLSRVNRTELRRKKLNVAVIAGKIIKDIVDEENKISFEIEEKIPVYADANMLEIVLRNLIQNSIKFSAKTKSPVIKLFRSKETETNVFVVEDNGIGFDMGRYDDLFAPFKRLHSKEDYEGSGIGLATVYRIIKKHQGSIWAESKIGTGSKFYVKL